MSYRIDPASGNSVFHASDIPTLSPLAIAFAAEEPSARFARSLEWFTNNHGRWFTATTGAPQPTHSLIKRGEELGLWRKDGDKAYWRHTALTWPWIRTSIALDEERGRPKQE